MTFGNALALLGLAAIAVPILIHLLGRHRSRIERFPTLRFIGVSRLNPTSRRRISDLPLLLIRCAIVAMAALALAQPWLELPGRATGTGDDAASRVVIVDTSASVRRREVPESLMVDAVSKRIETDTPTDAIDGAVRWLATRMGRREIVVISDFQRSSIDSVALTGIPRAVGLSFHVIPSAAPAPSERSDEGRRFSRDAIGTFVGPADIAGADAAWRAIGRQRPADTVGRIAVIYGSAAAPFAESAVPVDSAWMARIVVELQRDPLIRAAALGAEPRAAARAVDTVAAAPDGTPVVSAGRSGGRLLLFVHDDAGSLTSAALSQALVRTTEPAIPGSESDTSAWTPAELARFERPALPAPGPSGDASDGRWFWALCLILIAAETWMRSRTSARADSLQAPHPSPATERAA